MSTNSSSSEGMLVVSLFAAAASIGALLAWKLLDKPKPGGGSALPGAATGYDWAQTTGQPTYGPTSPYYTSDPIDYSLYTMSPQQQQQPQYY